MTFLLGTGSTLPLTSGITVSNRVRNEGGESSDSGLWQQLSSTLTTMLATQKEQANAAMLQPSFQPGATTFDPKRRRYLVWNAVGNITCREESMSNRIEIRFANASGRNKNDVIMDNSAFSMAALSYEGAFFANEPDPDEENPEDGDGGEPEAVGGSALKKKSSASSTIYYRAFPGHVNLAGANEVCKRCS